jgi:hypothetical protein
MLEAVQPRWSITVQDISGNSTVVKGYLAASDDKDFLLGRVASVAALLSAITTGQVVRYSVTYPHKNSDAGMPNSGQPILALARLSFQLTADPTYFTSVAIPLDTSWLLSSGPLAGIGLDLTNSELVDFATLISDDIWVDPFNEDIGPIYSGVAEGTL